MKACYPRAVNTPTAKDPHKQTVVQDPLAHQRLYPEDFERFTAKLQAESSVPKTLTSAAADERERCARIAEAYGANKPGQVGTTSKAIAAAIRSSAGVAPEEEEAQAPAFPPPVQPALAPLSTVLPPARPGPPPVAIPVQAAQEGPQQEAPKPPPIIQAVAPQLR